MKKMARFLVWELYRVFCLWGGILLVGIVYTTLARGLPTWVGELILWITHPIVMLL